MGSGRPALDEYIRKLKDSVDADTFTPNNTILLSRLHQTMDRLELKINDTRSNRAEEMDSLFLDMYKYCRFFTSVIKKHNAYNTPQYRKDNFAKEQKVKAYLTELEALKEKIGLRLTETPDVAPSVVQDAPSPPTLSNGAAPRAGRASDERRTFGVAGAGPFDGDDLEPNRLRGRHMHDHVALATSAKSPTSHDSTAASSPFASSKLRHLSQLGAGQPNQPTTAAAANQSQPSVMMSQVMPTAPPWADEQPVATAPAAGCDWAVGGEQNLAVVMPSDLIETFVAIAYPNTSQEIETCAILSGHVDGTTSPKVVRISHLLFPRQKGTANTCEALNEEELFAWQMERGLMTVGWIHTHPTQTCFMSSIDLHNHFAYQALLPESIAIVVAPQMAGGAGRVGYFMLTDYGLAYLRTCPKGGFHDHEDRLAPLYREIDSRMVSVTSDSVEVKDFR
ncbi:unnamed protein product [Vitrella brassicaformis CCMP3155]|uniref:MPN domain-containing protein n=1 Tax=Vitrella brassicaformis (strain CCMP3155) TaxID=1169540 RepID=A0A0G4GZH8_VITBC|nr:unnamed protein product [Vitrella brassicaformis CCMP3155]|eukprot:CEM36623.1 unnamed protein product [Vitrella brassicaformis CCMP3155]